MSQADKLQLVESGTLSRLHVMGRLVRAVLGLACLYALYQIFYSRDAIIESPVSSLPSLSLLVLLGLYVFNYVINIGFGKNWGRRPILYTIVILALLAAMSWLISGTPNSAVLGVPLWIWLVYLYAHLGISFLLAALIATPGCEMRSIPDLFGRIKGKGSQEHHCPVTLIKKIDDWENRLKTTNH
jgi:hypothetical protein